MLAELGDTLDWAAVAEALGPSERPTGILAWMARPSLLKLIQTIYSRSHLHRTKSIHGQVCDRMMSVLL